MIVGWLIYSLLIGVLLTGAARLFEGGLLGVSRPTRWVWLAAMVATTAAPPLLMWAPVDEPAAPLSVITSLPAIEFSVQDVEDGGWLPSLREILIGGWAVSSLVVLVIGGVSVLRLTRRRRNWQRREVDGVAVLVSTQTGPAVVGVRRCEIVIPEWALSLSAAERAYMLRHEEEHARAADPRLLLAGVVLAALVPWNLCVWYQLRRLVVAIEMDCDRRVLAGGGDVGAYAKLLLDFGQRLSHTMLPVTAFAEPVSILERRIRHMTARKPRRRVMRLFGAATAAAAVVTVAAALPVPREASLDVLRFQPERATAPGGTVTELVPPAVGAGVMQTDTPPGKNVACMKGQDFELCGQTLESGPMFTPFTTRPQLRNQAVVAHALQENYPAALRDAGIGGMVDTWFLIDETGRVLKAQVQKSSGYPELDAAAIRIAYTMEFTPALNRDEPVKVWVAMPIVFRTSPADRAADKASTEKALRVVRERIDDIGSDSKGGRSGTATFRTPPTLSNHSQVAAALQRLYPPLLRDAGIGGVVFILFDINASGRVTRAEVGESSGHPSLDDAALKVANQMRFNPARIGNRPVATRIGLPVEFRSQ